MNSLRITIFTFLAVVQILIGKNIVIAGDSGKQIAVTVSSVGPRNGTDDFGGVGVENFDHLKPRWYRRHESNFGLGQSSPITGTYVNLEIIDADKFGGSHGHGKCAGTRRKPYTALRLNAIDGARLTRFGLLWMDIDASNSLEFFHKGESVYKFSGKDATKLIRRKKLEKQKSAYFEFYFNDNTFDEIRFRDKGETFESDNHSLWYIMVGRTTTTTTTTTTINGTTTTAEGTTTTAEGITTTAEGVTTTAEGTTTTAEGTTTTAEGTTTTAEGTTATAEETTATAEETTATAEETTATAEETTVSAKETTATAKDTTATVEEATTTTTTEYCSTIATTEDTTATAEETTATARNQQQQQPS